MPYVSQNIKLKKEQDRRIKLTDAQRVEIFELYNLGISQRQLAKDFKVSRRLINFIIFPERLEQNKERRKERGGWKQYYDKNKHAETIKEHRRYKQNLYIKGQL